jgi:hypothetical protein
LLIGGLAALAVAVALGLRAFALPTERSTGVIRAGAAIEIRYLLCGRQRVHFVRLLDYGPGYGSGYVGPVMWQLRSHSGAPLERLTVGKIPPGFEEQVRRLPLPGPSGRTVVTNPDGEDVMSFVFSELRRDRIFRADYVYLSPSRFEASKRKYCAKRRSARRYRLASFPFFGFALLGLAGALVQRVRAERSRDRRARRG